MTPKRPPIRVMQPGPVLGWVEPLPDRTAPDPDPGDRVSLPPIRCTRAQRDAWQRKAAVRGKNLSELIRDYLDSLE